MEFLKSFDLQLYELTEAAGTLIFSRPAESFNQAQLFVKRLSEKVAPHQEALEQKFSEELIWLLDYCGEISTDEALTAHEMLYRLSCWAVLNFESPEAKFPPYHPPLPEYKEMVTRGDVNTIIESRVIPILCGFIREMDTIMAAIDDIEHKLASITGQDERVVNLEQEVKRLREQSLGFSGLLQSRPRTPIYE